MNFIHFFLLWHCDEMRACGRPMRQSNLYRNIRHLGIHPSYWLERHKPFLIAFASLLLLADENAFCFVFKL